MRIRPLNNYILAKPLEITESVTLRSDSFKLDQTRWAKVLDVGPGGATAYASEVRTPPVKKDDVIYTALHGILTVEDDNYLISEYDTLMKYTGDTANLTPEHMIPIGSYVLIEPLEEKEKDVMIVGSQQDLGLPMGKVIKVGTGWKRLDGSDFEFQVKEGQMVYFDRARAVIIDARHIDQKVDLLLVQHGELLGVVEEE